MVAAASAPTTFNGGVNYGNATLTTPILSAPPDMFAGTGVNGLTKPTWYQPQTFNPVDITGQYNTTQDVQKAYNDLANNYYNGGDWHSRNAGNAFSSLFNGGTNFNDLMSKMNTDFYSYGLNRDQMMQIANDLSTITNDTGVNSGVGAAYQWLQNQNNQISNTQNQNVAGYNATQNTNTKDLQNLYQGAIAENKLLGQLSARGLLNSYMNGGAGTGDMQQLQDALDQAQNTSGTSLANELNDLSTQGQSYLNAENNYQNELNNFQTMQNNNKPGWTQYLSTGISALPLIMGL